MLNKQVSIFSKFKTLVDQYYNPAAGVMKEKCSVEGTEQASKYISRSLPVTDNDEEQEITKTESSTIPEQ